MNKISIVILFSIVGQCLLAQKPDTIKDLPAEQVEVIKLFEARLEDARKVNTIPEPPAQRVLETFDYEVNIRPLLLEYPEPSIKPVGLPKEVAAKKYNGFARIAAGNLNTLDAALAYNFLTAQESEFQISGNCLTMNNKKERFQQRRLINGAFDFKHGLSSLVSVSAGAHYGLNDVTFYGSPLETIDADTSIYFRKIHQYGVNFGLFNDVENDFGVDYELNFAYNFMSLQDEILRENNFLIDGKLIKSLKNNFTLFAEGKVDVSSILDTSTIAYNNYFIKPGLQFSNEQFNLHAAVNVAFVNGKTLALPDVEMAFTAFNQSLVPYLFWKSNVQKNGLFQLFNYNPYLRSDVAIQPINTIHYRPGLGLKGKYKGLQYNTSFSYGRADNLILFRNHVDGKGLRKFDIERANSEVLELNVEGQYRVNNKLDVNAHFALFDYSVIAWHLPTYTFTVGAEYKMLENKLSIHPKLYIRDGVTVLNDDAEQEELPYMLDLNLEVEYTVHKNFRVFGQVNNILASEYQQWYDYSNFGLNAKGGLKLIF